MNIPNVSAPPLFGAPIGGGVEMQAIRTARDLPTPDRGPEQLEAQFEGQMNQKLIQVGFQVAEGAIRATEESFLARGKREFALGPEGGTGAEDLRRSAQAKIQDATVDGELNSFGLPQHDPMLLGGSISSLAELEEVLAQTNYDKWTDVIDAAMPHIRDTVLARTPLLSRRRLERWINEQGDSLRARYAVQAASAQTDMARNLQMEQIQNAINDGDVDSATALVLNGVKTGLLTSQQSMMLTMSISNLAPINYHSNRLASILSTQGEEAALQHLGQIQNQLTSEEGSNPVFRDEETGQYRIGNVTQAQYDSIEENLMKRISDARSLQSLRDNTRTQALDAELQGMWELDMLSYSHLQDLGLLEEGREPYTRLHRYWLNVIESSRDEHAPATAGFDRQRQEMMDTLRERVMRKELVDPEALQNEILELMTFRVQNEEGETVRLFRPEELSDLQADLRSHMNRLLSETSYGDIVTSFVSGLQERVPSNVSAAEARVWAEANRRDTSVFYSELNRLQRMRDSGELSESQFTDAIQRASDNIMSVQSDGNMRTWSYLWDGELRQVDASRLAYTILSNDGESVWENYKSNRNFKRVTNLMEQGAFAGIAELGEFGADITRFQNGLERALSDTFIYYDIDMNMETPYDAYRDERNIPYLLVDTRKTGTPNANVTMRGYIRNIAEEGQPDDIRYRLSVRTDPRTNSPEMVIYNENTRSWDFVSSLPPELQRDIGVLETLIPTTPTGGVNIATPPRGGVSGSRDQGRTDESIQTEVSQYYQSIQPITNRATLQRMLDRNSNRQGGAMTPAQRRATEMRLEELQ